MARLSPVVIVAVTCPVCEQEILVPVAVEVHGTTVTTWVDDGTATEAHVKAHLN
jgi:hypothetical protein